jgi:hypothetical protein
VIGENSPKAYNCHDVAGAALATPNPALELPIDNAVGYFPCGPSRDRVKLMKTLHSFGLVPAAPPEGSPY